MAAHDEPHDATPMEELVNYHYNNPLKAAPKPPSRRRM
jgi:hypothetical protein